MQKIDSNFIKGKFDSFDQIFFDGLLPNYSFIFKVKEIKDGKVPPGKLHPRSRMETHAEDLQIWVAELFEGQDYDTISQDFDMTLKHEMVHAELYRLHKPWRHDQPEAEQEFNIIAGKIGAYPFLGSFRSAV